MGKEKISQRLNDIQSDSSRLGFISGLI